MSKERPTGRRAVWFGLLGTPVLLVAAITLIGVTAGSAGPSTSTAPTAAGQASGGAVTHTTALGAGTQTIQELMNYWTPQAMAAAKPMDMVYDGSPTKAAGSVETIPTSSAELKVVRVNADGSVSTMSVSPQSGPQALTEPFHSNPPFSRWQYFAKYNPNSPGGGTNLAASTQAKMFFTQNGLNFVCSASVVGPDGVWTAGHCVNDGSQTFSTNVLFCPSHDNGAPMPGVGCWGAESLVTSTVWHNTGNLDHDVGAADVSDTGTVNATLIGNFTGWLGFAFVNVAEGTSESFNTHFMAFGYPQAAPFNGQKIHVCAAPLAYVDAAVAGGQDSKSIGCDMTGGSSGGPWIIGISRHPNQIGGIPPPGLQNAVFGHNDWRHDDPNTPALEEPEMNSPPFNCLAVVVFRIANDIPAAACP
jgi:V8-like Glu-specific endopeptidase